MKRKLRKEKKTQIARMQYNNKICTLQISSLYYLHIPLFKGTVLK